MRRATEIIQNLAFLQLDTEPKIDNLDVKSLIRYDIFQFHIPMNNIFLMKVLKGCEYLFINYSQGRLLKPFNVLSLHVLDKRDPIEQFGKNVHVIFVVNSFVEFQDVWMTDLVQDLYLSL